MKFYKELKMKLRFNTIDEDKFDFKEYLDNRDSVETGVEAAEKYLKKKWFKPGKITELLFLEDLVLNSNIERLVRDAIKCKKYSPFHEKDWENINVKKWVNWGIFEYLPYECLIEEVFTHIDKARMWA